MGDPYEILGVGRDASPDDVKRAYVEMSLRYHPDRNGSNGRNGSGGSDGAEKGREERYAEVREAYDLLKDGTQRRIYDLFGPSAVDLYRSHVLDSAGDPLGPALAAGPVRSAALIAAVLGLLVVQPCAFLARALGKPDGTMAGRTWMETMTPTWAAGTCYAAVLAGGSGTVVWLHLLQWLLMMAQAVSVASKLDSGPDDGRTWPSAFVPLLVSLLLRTVETSSSSYTPPPGGNKGGNKDGPPPRRAALLLGASLLATAASVPLLFAAGARVSCPGVDGMADDAVAFLSSPPSAGGGGPPKGLAGYMGDGGEGGGGLARDACRVAAYALGGFSAAFPPARFLVLRGPPGPDLEPEACPEIETAEERERRGIFRRRRKRGEAGGGRNPVRRVLEAASVFSHMRREKGGKARGRRAEAGHDGDGAEGAPSDDEVDWSKWRYGRSDDYVVRSDEVSLIKELASRVLKRADEKACRDGGGDGTTAAATSAAPPSCPESDLVFPSLSGGAPVAPYRTFLERADSVPWGGLPAESNRWYPRRNPRHSPAKISSHVDGGRLMSAYLKIMKWPSDLHARFPFRLCRDGCGSEVSLLHTLEWREKYMPWCVSEGGVRFNKAGFVYASGHSRPGRGQRAGGGTAPPYPLADAGHSIVWYRPALATVDDPEVYGRVLINTLERAVSDSLLRNGGEVGRFNVLMDCAGMGSRNSPPVREIKRIFSFMQDHFPDRLGVLLIANLGTVPRMLMNLVLPFVTEDVRAKIHVIPTGTDERMAMLGQIMDADQVPGWLVGGRGGEGRRNEFRAEEYYGSGAACVLSDEEATEYLRTMPYHA